MAMHGPDFKSQFVDLAPASNADVGRTIAHLMQLDVSDKGKLIGRVLTEALPNGALPAVTSRILTSEPAPNGLATVVNMQMVGDTRYYDAAGFPGRTVGLSTTALPSATQNDNRSWLDYRDRVPGSRRDSEPTACSSAPC